MAANYPPLSSNLKYMPYLIQLVILTLLAVVVSCALI
jgi:hypothetical protein